MSNAGTPIETSAGTLYVRAVDANHVYVDGSGNGKFITLRRRKFAVSSHVRIDPDGTLTPTYISNKSIYMSVLGDYSAFPKIAPTYYRLAEQLILDATKTYLAEHSDALKLAAQEKWQMDLRSAEYKLVEAENAHQAALENLKAVKAAQPD